MNLPTFETRYGGMCTDELISTAVAAGWDDSEWEAQYALPDDDPHLPELCDCILEDAIAYLEAKDAAVTQ